MPRGQTCLSLEVLKSEGAGVLYVDIVPEWGDELKVLQADGVDLEMQPYCSDAKQDTPPAAGPYTLPKNPRK